MLWTMTDKQARFVAEYLVDCNATQAAIRAGYSSKTAYSIGQRLMRDPDIQGEIQAGMSGLQERTELSQKYVIDNLREIVSRCMEGEDFKPHGALKALELLGKHLRMFTDKIQVKEETVPLVFMWQGEDSTEQAGE